MLRRGNRPPSPRRSRAELRERLRAAADQRQPDEARIWDRIEAGMAETPVAGGSSEHLAERLFEGTRTRRAWPRVVMASVATMTVAGLVSAVAWELAEHTGNSPALPVGQQRGSESATETPGSSPSAASPTRGTGQATGRNSPAPSSSASRSPDSSSPTARTSSPGDGNAPLTVTGTLDANSTEYWAQNNLALKVRRPLRELAVTIQVARTERVEATGSWLSLPTNDFKISTDTGAEAVTYRWTLLPGRTIQPGSYTLAAQYNRTRDHDPRKDTFTLRAEAGEGGGGERSADLRGHF